jgi:hypothetical protein
MDRDLCVTEDLLSHGTKLFSRLADPFSDIYHVAELRHEVASYVLECRESHKAVHVDFNVLRITS